VGQRLGAKDPAGARRSVQQATRMAVGIMTIWGILFILFPRTWVLLFTSDPGVLAYSIPLLPIMGLLQPPLAVAMIMAGALRGAGQTSIVLAGAILGGWVIRLPLAYFGGVVSGVGMTLVWISMILDWIVRGAVFGWQFRRVQLKDVRL